MTHAEWIEAVFNKYLEKHNPERAESDHVLDFLDKNRDFKLSVRRSYLDVKKCSEKWTEKLNQRNRNLQNSGSVEEILVFSDGSRLVRLINQTAKDWEGKHMGHCVSSYSSHDGIYSLRDEDQMPHCTLEMKYHTINQIKGKANRAVAPRYHQQVVEGIKKIAGNVTGRDLENIGYEKIDQAQKDKLETYFTGLIFNSAGDLRIKNPLTDYLGCFYYKNSKLKQIKKFEDFDGFVFDKIFKSTESSVESFKEMLSLCPNIEPHALQTVTGQGRTEFVKAWIEIVGVNKLPFAYTSSLLSWAIESGNLETLNYVISVVKEKKQQIARDPSFSFLRTDFFDGALTEAIQARRIEFVRALIEVGAKVSCVHVDSLAKMACKERDENILKMCLTVNEFDLGPQCVEFISQFFKEDRFDLLDMVLDSIKNQPKEVVNSFIEWAAHGHADSFWVYLHEKLGFSEMTRINFMIKILKTKKEKPIPHSSRISVLESLKAKGIDLRFKGSKFLLNCVNASTSSNIGIVFWFISNDYLSLEELAEVKDEIILKMMPHLAQPAQGQSFLTKMIALQRKTIIAKMFSLGIKPLDQIKAEVDFFLQLPLEEQLENYTKSNRNEWHNIILSKGAYEDPSSGKTYEHYGKFLKEKRKELKDE